MCMVRSDGAAQGPDDDAESEARPQENASAATLPVHQSTCTATYLCDSTRVGPVQEADHKSQRRDS